MNENNIFEKQKDFMIACSQKLSETPKFNEESGLWKDLIFEEFKELMNAGNLVEVASEAVDLIYVTVGLLNNLGINGQKVFDAIHAANMKKLPIRKREDGKVLKPDGWKPADVRSIIYES
uniref:Phosphoribosyl-ATP diphosphatase n=1 Tax=viral metagenome TaxID=1070528 RepID=A0A6H1ZNM6_9ZZZZ